MKRSSAASTRIGFPTESGSVKTSSSSPSPSASQSADPVGQALDWRKAELNAWTKLVLGPQRRSDRPAGVGCSHGPKATRVTTKESNPTRREFPSAIRKLAREISERFRPEKIILFGSHAYGTPPPTATSISW